uniref:Secreted protein n=1 Tax=Heliothis virescens TaxID=7102 RepID=A0A2A4IZG6_HELVI
MLSMRLLQAVVALCTVLVLILRQRWSCAGLLVSTQRPLGPAAKRASFDDQQVAGQPPYLPAQILAAGVTHQAKNKHLQTACPCGGDWQLPETTAPWKPWGRCPPYKRDPDISVDNECIGHAPRDG